MRAAATDLTRRAIAVLILLVAAYLLFKIVLSAVMAVVWIAVLVVAVVGVIWALRAIL